MYAILAALNAYFAITEYQAGKPYALSAALCIGMVVITIQEARSK